VALINQDGQSFDPTKTPGAFGGPPRDAPRETTQPVSSAMVADQLARAQANERVLSPLVFDSTQRPPTVGPARPRSITPAPPIIPMGAVAPRPIAPSQSRLRMPGVPTGRAGAPSIILTDAPALPPPTPTPTRETHAPEPSAPSGSVAVAAPAVQAVPAPGSGAGRVIPPRPSVDAVTAAYLDSPLARAARDLAATRPLTHQPAASTTDSPSRGLPTAVADPGKQITGGFGDAGQAQYFPLDGSELRELIKAELDTIAGQLDDDLRFSMALTYPRVRARVIVEVEAYVSEQSFQIVRVPPPHTRTPLEIARERAEEVCFVVLVERIEMLPDGQSVSPPNAIREELGLVVPHKHAIMTPSGRLIVDLPAAPTVPAAMVSSPLPAIGR